MGPERDDGSLWDITCPKRPGRLPGVTMAGFGDRGIVPPDFRLIPHPAVTLFLMFDGTIAFEGASGLRQGSFVTGLGFGDVLRALRMDGFACLQVRLSPVVARAALGLELSDLDGSMVPLEGLCDPDAARFCERLGELSSWEDRFTQAEDWLARRCADAARVDPEVARVWHRIVAGRGGDRIADLATEVGWSRKRLWTRFGAQIGLPPKRAASLVRFDHAVHRLVSGQAPAATAADLGYADQSHLNREIASFTGLTPGTVVNEPFLAVDDKAWGWPSRPPNPGSRAGG